VLNPEAVVKRRLLLDVVVASVLEHRAGNPGALRELERFVAEVVNRDAGRRVAELVRENIGKSIPDIVELVDREVLSEVLPYER